MKTVSKRTTERMAVDFAAMPEHTSDAMCRTLLCCLSRMFENPDIKTDYERWKVNRQQKGTTT